MNIYYAPVICNHAPPQPLSRAGDSRANECAVFLTYALSL